ncbi:hypothetical protein MMC13_003306 [Lambiella insularis]|nr:hypothetical protein [Lambiella insularis]
MAPSQTSTQNVKQVGTIESYDRWAPHYDISSGNNGNNMQGLDDRELQTLLPTFLSLLPAPPPTASGLRLVDFGCGTGRNTRKLLAVPGAVVIGLDASRKMLDVASKLCRKHYESLPAESRASQLVLEEYDPLRQTAPPECAQAASGVVSTLVMEHLPLEAFWASMAMLVAVGGCVLVTNIHPEMGATSQGGFVDKDTGEKIWGASWVYGIEETAQAARRAGFETVEVREAVGSAGFKGGRAGEWEGSRLPYLCNGTTSPVISSLLRYIDDRMAEVELPDDIPRVGPSHLPAVAEKEVERQLEFPLPPGREPKPSSWILKSKTVLVFSNPDADNPYDWPKPKKAAIVLAGVVLVLNSTIGSSLSSDNQSLYTHFDVSQVEQTVLPNSIYLVGYMLGPLFFAPLSEYYGRQAILQATFAGFTLFTLATCLAPNWPAFIIFRLLAGTFASTPISVIGGLYADLYRSPVTRGRAMAVFMAATMFGPVCGPIISGYLSPVGWNWPFWFSLILAGVSCVMLACVPETFGPVILERRARKVRERHPSVDIHALSELERTTTFWQDMKITLARPFRMFFEEAIVLLACLYMALIFAVLYIFFEAYPLIYPPIYGFTLGEEGLAFLPLTVGAWCACCIYLYWDSILEAAKARDAPWSRQEEYRRLPLASIGGPFFSIGCFWIGWAARPTVHWIVPILGGIPWGIGYLLLFMSLMNYLVDNYEVYSASALAASTCTRSLFGAVLPFAATPMYKALGVAWACSLLGFVTLGMCLIPLGFIKYGDRIRASSKFCQELAERKKEKSMEESSPPRGEATA